jgi:REP element-mobilizing transposase RayT
VAALRKRIERYADSGYGACYLSDPAVAQLVQDALLYFLRYRLPNWCIMPNHVHVLIEVIEGYTVSDIVHIWKSFTAGRANRLLGLTGSFWMPEYYDRYIRDANHYQTVDQYISENPVKAGLVERKGLWRWSKDHFDSRTEVCSSGNG